MKQSDCERWVELSDRVAIGDPLSDADRRFEREHVVTCATCAAEARVWLTLSQSLEDRSEPPHSLEPLPRRSRFERRSGWRWGLAGAGAVAAAAVAAVVWRAVPSPEQDPRPTSGNESPSEARVSLVLVAGDVAVGGAQASAGAELRASDVVRVREGRACLSYAKGSSACVGEDTEVRLVATDRDRRLMLESGAVVCRLDRQPPGVRFSVDTPQGRVTAKGTVFAVERLGDGGVGVRVHRGVVELETTTGSIRDLHAPAGAIIASGKIRRTETTGTDWHRDARLIEAADLWAEGAVAPVDIVAQPEAATIELDGIVLGASPVSILVGRGEHALTVTRSGLVPHRERFVVKGAERVSRMPVLEAVPPPAALAPPAVNPSGAHRNAVPVAVPTADELLARARELRSSARYREAGAAYQQLLKVHPNSAEARAALVSLGELQLSQLGSPAAALRSFDGYLVGGGALTQEARYGRIRALRQLGRTTEAQRASEEFVRDYPGSAQARSLREGSRQR